MDSQKELARLGERIEKNTDRLAFLRSNPPPEEDAVMEEEIARLERWIPLQKRLRALLLQG